MMFNRYIWVYSNVWNKKQNQTLAILGKSGLDRKTDFFDNAMETEIL